MLERMWGKSVLNLLKRSSQLFSTRAKLSQREEEIIIAVAVGFKEQGFTKEMAADAIRRLAIKRGGVSKFVKDIENNYVEEDSTYEHAPTDYEELLHGEATLISMAAAILVEGADIPKEEAIPAAIAFYDQFKKYHGRSFSSMSGVQKREEFIRGVIGYVGEELNPGYRYDPDSKRLLELREVFAKFIQTGKSLSMLAHTISESLGMGEAGAEEIVKSTIENAINTDSGAQEKAGDADRIHESKGVQRGEIFRAYPEPMRSWILNGGDVDQLAKGVGSFGSRNNPIPVNGAIGEIKYLAKLRTSDGMPICFHRLGSRESEATENPVDLYEIAVLDGSSKLTLYFDFYHPRRSNIAPPGFYLEEVGSSGNDAAWGYGVDKFVQDFPAGLPDALRDEYEGSLGDRLAEELDLHLSRLANH